MLSDVRKKGLVQLAWGGVLFLAFIGIGYWLRSMGWHHIPWEFAIPGGYALAGLIQLVTGVHFLQFSSQWDALKGWQRGVLGIAILLAASLFLFACAAAYISIYG